MRNSLSFFLLIVLYIACNPQPQSQVRELILTETIPIAKVKISDYIDSLRGIRLETPDSVLIPENFRPIVTDKYIIAASASDIQLFTNTGKYLRRITTKGRGPEEYLWINSHYFDKENEHYYVAGNDKQLLVFDLKNGKFLKRYTFPYTINHILRISQDTILYQPVPSFADEICPYILCSTTLDGRIIDSLPMCISTRNLFTATSTSLPNGQIRLKTDLSDTLFTIDHFRKIPYLIVKGKYTDPTFTVKVGLVYENQHYNFFRTFPIKAEFDKDGMTGSVIQGQESVYRYNKHNFTLEKVDYIQIDPLGMITDHSSLCMQPELTWFSVSAFKFHKALQRITEKGQLSPEWEKLYREVKEDDNPLIFIGRTK